MASVVGGGQGKREVAAGAVGSRQSSVAAAVAAAVELRQNPTMSWWGSERWASGGRR